MRQQARSSSGRLQCASCRCSRRLARCTAAVARRTAALLSRYARRARAHVQPRVPRCTPQMLAAAVVRGGHRRAQEPANTRPPAAARCVSSRCRSGVRQPSRDRRRSFPVVSTPGMRGSRLSARSHCAATTGRLAEAARRGPGRIGRSRFDRCDFERTLRDRWRLRLRKRRREDHRQADQCAFHLFSLQIFTDVDPGEVPSRKAGDGNGLIRRRVALQKRHDFW